jgi:hypothetical protein
MGQITNRWQNLKVFGRYPTSWVSNSGSLLPSTDHSQEVASHTRIMPPKGRAKEGIL